MSGRRRRSLSRGSNRALSNSSTSSTQGKVATVVSVAVVNVDLDQASGEGDEDLIRSKRQTAALVKNACQYAVDGKEVVAATSTDTNKPVSLAVVGAGSTQANAAEQQENVVTPNTLEEQQRSAISKLDDVLDTASLPSSHISTSGSRAIPIQLGPAEADGSSKRSAKRSSQSRRSRGSLSRHRRRTSSRSRSSKSLRRPGSRSQRSRTRGIPSHRPRKSGSRSSKSSRSSRSKACRCAIIAAMEQGTHTESEKRDFAALLNCPKPYCKQCKVLRKRLNLPSAKTCETECNLEVSGEIGDQLGESGQRDVPVKYKADQPTMESMGVKFCTCLECSKYRQQGEIMPARSAQELITTPSKAQPQPGVKVTRYRRTTRKTPQCPFCDLRKLRKGTVSSRKGGSKKKCGLKAASPAGSLHSTFPINLRETKQVPSPYHTPQKRSIPIQRTPGTAGTQYWTPSVQIAGPAIPPAARTARPVISPGISVQTAKLGPSPGISKQSAKPGQSPGTSTRTARPVKATERWASWSRQRSTSSSSGLQQTPTAPTGRTHALAGPKQPQISTTTSSKDKRSISQTSAGSSPGDTSALKSTGATKTVENATKQAGTYIPERDYNPVCNCTNCRKERKLREENDVCDCYDCITEMRSTISAGKSSQKSSASPHRPIRMKAEYTWVKKLLKIQQPAGRYHTPNEKRVEYPWQKDSKKSASLAHSHQSGGATSRDRSSSSHHGISTPSVSQQSQPSSATTGDSHTASQTEPSKQQEDAQSGFKTANKSTSSAAGTSQTPSPYITPRSTRKSSRSTRKSSRSSRKSRRARRGRHAGQPRWPSSSDESESWSEPEQESGSGSYRTPRSRSRSQRKSKKRKPWR